MTTTPQQMGNRNKSSGMTNKSSNKDNSINKDNTTG